MIRILGLAVALSVLPLTNALAEPPPQPQAPGARTDAQLVALFDYWMTEQAAGRMSREQARAQAQSLSPEEQQRLRAAVTARSDAALAESEERARRSAAALAESEERARRSAAALAESEERVRRSAEEARRSAEEARRSEEDLRRAQEELRRAHEAAQRALGGPRS
ncbi:hypothetical protein [Brevundimonas sp.]|uniref:hypothetical protein n=1 Tax=Brevundimonas sp. TaxID=1871086 RepID=UPI002617D063|nr:hypothetical protein [Brevundimonas sp.]